MEVNSKAESIKEEIERDSRCYKIRCFVPLRVKAWAFLILAGALLTAVLYGILYATTYPDMAAFQDAVVLKSHVHSMSLVDRSVVELSVCS